MAKKENLCTSLDVRNLSEYITTQVRDNARIIQFIQREDPVIIAALKGVYSGGATDFVDSSGPWNGPVQTPFPYADETTGTLQENSGDASLADITATSSAVTELWTFTFTSETAFTVVGEVSGTQTAGTTSSDYSNDYISIDADDWSGTPVAGDQFFVCTYKYYPLIVALSAKLAAALTIESVYQGVSEEMSMQASRLRTEGQTILQALQKPNAPDGMRLDSYSARDLSPEGIQYYVTMYGNDVGSYADNPRTPWDDSSSGGSMDFLVGPAWI